MKTLFEEPARRAVLDRLGGLRADTPRRWGTLAPEAMLCHLADGLRMTFDEVRYAVRPSAWFLRNALARYLVISALPWPHGQIEAPREYYGIQPAGDFEAARRRVVEYVERFARGPNQPWGVHPYLGPLGADDWAKLEYHHLDHHLRQFEL